jgi:SPP1 family predicted phage head-tail adaptor
MAALQPDLNRRLLLETRERVADGAGGFVETWVPLGDLWAEVSPRTGRRAEHETLPTALVRYRILVRAAPPGHSARPKPDQRFREGARLFRIEAVAAADPGQRFLECYAVEEEVAP